MLACLYTHLEMGTSLLYHAVVDTNNGTEAQNKLLKHSYSPKHKKISLSCVVTLLVGCGSVMHSCKGQMTSGHCFLSTG